MLPPQFTWDARVEKFRAPAIARRACMEFFAKQQHPDRGLFFAGRKRATLLPSAGDDAPALPASGPHRVEERMGAAARWCCRPAAAKTFVALTAMADVGRNTLVVAPTIELMTQWYSLLVDAFAIEVGILGGGYHDLREVTVTTYDSAYRYARRLRQPFRFVDLR